MSDFPWLTTLIVLPLVGAVVTGAKPTSQKPSSSVR